MQCLSGNAGRLARTRSELVHISQGATGCVSEEYSETQGVLYVCCRVRLPGIAEWIYRELRRRKPLQQSPRPPCNGNEVLAKAQVTCIRELFFEEGLLYAAIAKATEFDVKIVTKYVYMEDFNWPLPGQCKVRVSKLDAYKGQIDGWLEGNKQERKKQRYTATRIVNQLVEEHPNSDSLI